MARLGPLLAGLALVLGTALVHGLWTQRWSKSADLAAAAARLDGLPDDLGEWKAEPGPEDREALADAGAEGWWLRRYTNQRTGAKVDVVLLCGPSGRMCVHRPENCYGGAGYELAASPARYTPTGADPGSAEFWTARFTREEVSDPVNLRIFWSWFADGAWHAPDNPRWALAHVPALYKLYVIHEEPPGPPVAVADDPAAQLLRLLLPALSRALGDS